MISISFLNKVITDKLSTNCSFASAFLFIVYSAELGVVSIAFLAGAVFARGGAAKAILFPSSSSSHHFSYHIAKGKAAGLPGSKYTGISVCYRSCFWTLPGSPSDLNTGNGIEGAMVCTSLGSLLRPLFYFLCSNLKANPV